LTVNGFFATFTLVPEQDRFRPSQNRKGKKGEREKGGRGGGRKKGKEKKKKTRLPFNARIPTSAGSSADPRRLASRGLRKGERKRGKKKKEKETLLSHLFLISLL